MRQPRIGRRYGSRPSPGNTVASFEASPPTTGKPARSTDRPALAQAIRRSLCLLNALDQVGVLFAVFLPHRLYRRLERLLVVDLDDLDAGCFDLLDRFLFHLVPKLAFFELRFFGEFRDQRLVLFAERVP